MGRTQAVEPGSAASAPVRILCSAAPQEALRTLGPAFERATGRRVAFTFAFAPEVQQRLDAGETADAVILPVRLPAMLEKSRSWRAERPLILARVGIGVIVHRSARLPDISTVEAVRTLLLEARAIAWPNFSHSDRQSFEPGHRAPRHRRRAATKVDHAGGNSRGRGTCRER